ncbi:MAG: hypothetical protein HCA25_13425 [Dolichospermum sp. DET50]|jgi:hypothetical protein|nr:hypothetical protein [Dolichospermum sp. DET66]MBS3033239.1 hypothetical protein [Dolichospermum sp. DET67]MBS3038443.1 hypothetical protein [Dolichospermum sp. DET50]QSX70323.1 MAG: hypothetical protein EZY12_12675 [Dolichospermum sp. DET69]
MTKKKILQEEQSYTFRSYFELPYDIEEILAELGYSFVKKAVDLPKTSHTLEKIAELKHKIISFLPLVSLNNETARRETLVSPLLLEIITYCQCQMKIEYAVNVNNWLKGNLDYLLRSQQSLLVIEAKNDDLSRGFTQLAVELIALSEIEENKSIFYGAVTTGEIWRFGKLDRQQKQITQDMTLLRIPDDIEEIGHILVGILQMED